MDAQGFLRGIWALEVNKIYKMELVDWDSHFIHLLQTMICIVVYINPKVHQKKDCFLKLRALAIGITQPWILVGDLNKIIGLMEKRGGAAVDHNRCIRFRN